MKKDAVGKKISAGKPKPWLVRFQGAAEMDLIEAAALLCGLSKNAFVARSAELRARRLLGEPLSSSLGKFEIISAGDEERESAA